MNLRTDHPLIEGDVVTIKKIKSPKMLVVSVWDNQCKVIWFNEGQYQEATIHDAFLIKERDMTINMESNFAYVSVVKDARFVDHMKKGQWIQAIKVTREILGIGLKDAKDFVDKQRLNTW